MNRAALAAFFFLLLTLPAGADAPAPSSAALVAQGKADAASGLPLLALADWAKAATLDPASPDVYDARAAFHVGRGEWDAAEKDAAKAVQLSPAPARLDAQGDIFAHLGRHREAVRAYSRALSLTVGASKTAADWVTNGLKWEAAGQGEKAQACYEQAEGFQPPSVDAQRRSLALFTAWGDMQNALSFANLLLLQDNTNPQAYADRAAILRQTGDWNGAIADAGSAIARAPQDPAAWLARGVTYSEQAQTMKGDEAHAARAKAVDDFSRALLLDPNNVKAVSARGLAFYAQGDLSRALADLDRAADLGAGFSVVFLFRANIHALRHEDALAVADFTRALQLDPSDARAVTGRAEALARMKRAPAP